MSEEKKKIMEDKSTPDIFKIKLVVLVNNRQRHEVNREYLPGSNNGCNNIINIPNTAEGIGREILELIKAKEENKEVVIINNPPKPAYPCHYGKHCSCDSGDKNHKTQEDQAAHILAGSMCKEVDKGIMEKLWKEYEKDKEEKTDSVQDLIERLTKVYENSGEEIKSLVSTAIEETKKEIAKNWRDENFNPPDIKVIKKVEERRNKDIVIWKMYEATTNLARELSDELRKIGRDKESKKIYL